MIIRRISAGEEFRLHSSICERNFAQPNFGYFVLETEGGDSLEAAELGMFGARLAAARVAG